MPTPSGQANTRRLSESRPVKDSSSSVAWRNTLADFSRQWSGDFLSGLTNHLGPIRKGFKTCPEAQTSLLFLTANAVGPNSVVCWRNLQQTTGLLRTRYPAQRLDGPGRLLDRRSGLFINRVCCFISKSSVPWCIPDVEVRWPQSSLEEARATIQVNSYCE
jgi:hypothetical protein